MHVAHTENLEPRTDEGGEGATIPESDWGEH